jgi:hypothetical protein
MPGRGARHHGLAYPGSVEHALKEDAACIFNKPSRQPSLVRGLKVVAAETSPAFEVHSAVSLSSEGLPDLLFF